MSVLWHLYKTTIDFTHSIKQVQGLVDTSCLQPHPHAGSTLEVALNHGNKKWVDFKINKQAIEKVLQDYRNKNIGIKDTEQIVKELQSKIAKALSLPQKNVAIKFYETGKYGVEIR